MHAAFCLVMSTYIVLVRAEMRLKQLVFLEVKSFIPDLQISDSFCFLEALIFSHSYEDTVTYLIGLGFNLQARQF